MGFPGEKVWIGKRKTPGPVKGRGWLEVRCMFVSIRGFDSRNPWVAMVGYWMSLAGEPESLKSCGFRIFFALCFAKATS